MKLSKILSKVKVLNSYTDMDIVDIIYDSRKVTEGCAFVCLCGSASDGHDYAKSAQEKGASVIIAHKEIDVNIPVVIVENTRQALALMSIEFFERPFEKMKTAAITGTKGKTSVSYMMQSILEAQGYNRTLMFGATAKFGGLNYFYESHGDFNMIDHDGAIEKGLIPEDYKVWWGYEDDKLFEFAKDELTRLSKEDKPFYLVMETADTHFPDGYVGPNTPTPRSSQYANVIAYSAEEVTKFVRWIQEQPFYENTTIVLIGDHLSMDKNFFKDMDTNYLRTTFNLIINPAGDLGNIPESRRYNRWWFNGDMFPTMLASIGVKIEGERLGLGTNLFSTKPTIIESMGKGKEGWQKFDHMLKYKSEFYNKNILEGNNAPFDNKNITTY